MTSISSTTRVQATSRQMSADLSGEKVLMSLKDNVYYSLSPVGARIWELIQDPTVVQTVVDQLLEEYDTDRPTCESDLCELLGEMAELGLVELEDGEAQ